MADKNKQQDTSSAARIRNNQRRCRARQREFVDDLRARIREYERAGVQATLDMRRAARAVALENSRLRSLLASRGVTREQVDMYLASFPDSGSDQGVNIQVAQTSGAFPAMYHAPQQAPSTPCVVVDAGYTAIAHEKPKRGQRPSNPPSNDNAPASGLDMLAVLADASAQQTCCGPTNPCSPAGAPEAQSLPGSTFGLDAIGSLRGSGSSPATTTSPVAGPGVPGATTSHLEMSCTAAARIMASMSYTYRDRDEELAREALGCSGPDECFVKNTTLFQLLEGSDVL